jgi:hypothetical protein
MLSVTFKSIMKNVIMLSVNMLSVIMLSDMLSVVMLKSVLPQKILGTNSPTWQHKLAAETGSILTPDYCPEFCKYHSCHKTTCELLRIVIGLVARY